MKISFPSSQALGLPNFDVEIPSSWRIVDNPQVLLLVSADQPIADFLPNISVNGGRAQAGLTADFLVNQSIAQGIAGAKTVAFDDAEPWNVGDDGRSIDLNISIENLHLRQTQRITVINAPSERPLAFWFSLSGTCNREDHDSWNAILAAVNSFRLVPQW